jgi:hypothetical protein
MAETHAGPKPVAQRVTQPWRPRASTPTIGN